MIYSQSGLTFPLGVPQVLTGKGGSASRVGIEAAEGLVCRAEPWASDGCEPHGLKGEAGSSPLEREDRRVEVGRLVV